MSHDNPTKEEMARLKGRFAAREVTLQGTMTNKMPFFVYKNLGHYAFANSAANIITD
tara:strand:- start:3786 stop:3956 length:171 start_codon:yes stop_codon:yes gene_type:complete